MKTLTTDVPAGQIVVAPAAGRLLVQIGRERYTKRVNLSMAEAAELVAQLTEHLSAQ